MKNQYPKILHRNNIFVFKSPDLIDLRIRPNKILILLQGFAGTVLLLLGTYSFQAEILFVTILLAVLCAFSVRRQLKGRPLLGIVHSRMELILPSGNEYENSSVYNLQEFSGLESKSSSTKKVHYLFAGFINQKPRLILKLKNGSSKEMESLQSWMLTNLFSNTSTSRPSHIW